MGCAQGRNASAGALRTLWAICYLGAETMSTPTKCERCGGQIHASLEDARDCLLMAGVGRPPATIYVAKALARAACHCGVVSDYPHESKCGDCDAPHAHPGTHECVDRHACDVRFFEAQLEERDRDIQRTSDALDGANERVAELRACLDGLLGLREHFGWRCLTHRADGCDCWWCEAARLTE